MKQKKGGKQKDNKKKIQKNLECKRGSVRTRGGLTHQRTQRHQIKTRGSKQGSFYRLAYKEIKEQRIQFELFNTPEDGHKRPSSSRNVKAPLDLHLQQNSS